MTTIQTIKEAEEKLQELRAKYRPQFLDYDFEKDIFDLFTQTLLAVFESELESVPKDIDLKERWLQLCRDCNKTNRRKNILVDKTINEERARLRSHLTEVINYLKQK